VWTDAIKSGKKPTCVLPFFMVERQFFWRERFTFRKCFAFSTVLPPQGFC
jgi:hypothetical protein